VLRLAGGSAIGHSATHAHEDRVVAG
jgi:hypothetical protein